MATFLLVIALLVDGALAVLLIGVSGFLFGSGPQSAHMGGLFAVAYGAAILVCLAAPIVGFRLKRRGWVGAGLAVAWLPPAAALVVTAVPAPY